MKYTLAIFPLLTAAAWGQAEDVYKTLAKGDRVQITFRSGGTITGMLVPNPIGQPAKPVLREAEAPPEVAIDYTKETSITVDLSWEYPGLTGTMTLFKREIKEVKKLQSLDKETMDRLRKQKSQIQKELDKQNLQRVTDSKKKDKDALAASKDLKDKEKAEKDAAQAAAEDAKNQKAMEEGSKLLKKFHPDGGWGPDKFKDISQKTRMKLSTITPEETEFVQNYPLWTRAKEAMDKANATQQDQQQQQQQQQ
jgi:hypothetical protein